MENLTSPTEDNAALYSSPQTISMMKWSWKKVICFGSNLEGKFLAYVWFDCTYLSTVSPCPNWPLWFLPKLHNSRVISSGSSSTLDSSIRSSTTSSEKYKNQVLNLEKADIQEQIRKNSNFFKEIIRPYFAIKYIPFSMLAFKICSCRFNEKNRQVVGLV